MPSCQNKGFPGSCNLYNKTSFTIKKQKAIEGCLSHGSQVNRMNWAWRFTANLTEGFPDFPEL